MIRRNNHTNKSIFVTYQGVGFAANIIETFDENGEPTVMRNRVITSLAVLMLLLLSAGCSAADPHAGLAMAPMAGMPAEVQAAPVTVQQAYQFAVANPDILSEIPCYCGCGAMGHTSNYACYVAGKDENGQVLYDNHALGCSICVDITQDTMRLLKEGKSLPDIRAFVDQTYASFGPSNIP